VVEFEHDVDFALEFEVKFVFAIDIVKPIHGPQKSICPTVQSHDYHQTPNSSPLEMATQYLENLESILTDSSALFAAESSPQQDLFCMDDTLKLATTIDTKTAE
jgi:hypothetical protein